MCVLVVRDHILLSLSTRHRGKPRHYTGYVIYSSMHSLICSFAFFLCCTKYDHTRSQLTSAGSSAQLRPATLAQQRAPCDAVRCRVLLCGALLCCAGPCFAVLRDLLYLLIFRTSQYHSNYRTTHRYYYTRFVHNTRDPLRGRLTPPATLGRGKEECNKKHVKGAERRRPMIWCKQRFDNAKSCLCGASCPVVLSCAVCFCSRCTF